MTLAAEFGRFLAETTYEDLPPSVVDLVKLRILDLLGAALVGYRTGTYRSLLEVLGDGSAEAIIWGEGARHRLRDAVLVNSFLSHAAYVEDGSRFTGGHPSSVIIPAALSLGETRGAEGRQLILAVVLGYEIFLRLGRAIYPSTVVKGFQSTAVLGALGAAAAAASLLHLGSEASTHALAIAATLGAGLKEALRAPESQPLQVGRSSEGGLLAALWAARGAAGCETILEDGFLPAFGAPASDRAKILADLGTSFSIDETYVKLHGGCRGNHAPTDAVQDLVRRHSIRPEAIEAITVHVDSVTLAADIHDPRDGRQAQFSVPFAVAVAVLEGNAFPSQFTDAKVMDGRVSALMRKITVRADERLDREYPARRGARAEIVLTDGRRLATAVDLARGEPESPLSAEEIEAKFLALAGDVLGDRAREVRDRVRDLEKLHDVRELVERLSAPREGR